MKVATLHIAQLFGDNVQAIPTAFHEDFQRLECEYRFKLAKTPVKENLLAVLPAVSERDGWRLRVVSDGDDDLLDLQPNANIDQVYDTNKIQSYNDEEVSLFYSVEKKKVDGVLSVYDLQEFTSYFAGLAAKECYSAVFSILQDKLIMEVWGGEFEPFRTASIAMIKKGEALPQMPLPEVQKKRVDDCGKYCQWATSLPAILPEDLHIIEKPNEGAIAKMFDQLCLLLSVCYVADFSSVERDSLKIRISGFKMLVSELDKVKVRDLAFDTASVEQWFEIYDWCYTGGYTSDRLVISRNIVSLNCTDNSLLKLNPSTLGAIKSNFRIFEQDNVRQYIKVRNDLSKDLLDIQVEINNIVEGFAGDFRKNVVGLGTFFLTLVVVRVVANGQWMGAFSTQIVALSFVFIALSVVLLIYSRRNLEQREKLYTKHYGQLRERYKLLLSTEEADKIFEDSDPNKVGTHSNYIKCQKKTYTLIWIGTLVAMSLFLIDVWCFNMFESTNLFKSIKTIVSCCTKNM